MTSRYRMERERGRKEASQQLAALRKKWPLAFPSDDQGVRPLAMGAAREIAATMNWPLPYTLGVLGSWKMAQAYCEAVLSHDQRIGLDGGPAEAVDAKAKNLAAKRLEELSLGETDKKPAKTPVRVPAKPEPAPKLHVETPEQLRARVRASLLRRIA
jgi:sRNA-binding protein